MEFAAGFDHIVYGWFFFAIVLVVLAVLGYLGWRKVQGLSGDQKMAIKNGINEVFVRASRREGSLAQLLDAGTGVG